MFGIIACFWQVMTLINSVSWIEGFALDRPGHEFVKAPGLLASLSALLRKKGARIWNKGENTKRRDKNPINHFPHETDGLGRSAGALLLGVNRACVIERFLARRCFESRAFVFFMVSIATDAAYTRAEPLPSMG